MQCEAISDFHVTLDVARVNANGPFRQRPINWHVPLTFKQFTVSITGYSGDCTRLGNLYLQYQRIPYKVMEVPPG
jgi:hypothetical protein